MEKYTVLNSYRVDKKVCKIMEMIKDEIVRSIHPRSLILKGSFGRGEASVIESNKKLDFLSDCEIIVIPNKRIKRGELSELSTRLTKETGLKVEITDIEPELKFCIALRLWSRILPTIDNYELKYGSRVIYGENFLEKLPNFKAEDIPTWEGIRLLFNRMIEAVQYFSLKCHDEYLSKEGERHLFFWINKVILACQDALLILAKKYHYSYKVRNDTFCEIFRKHFKALDEQIPNFLPLTVKATEYKLNPSKIYSKDVGFWFDVAEITDKVFRYIIEKEMKITFNSYVEFQEKYLRHPYIWKKYYRGLSPNTIYQNLRSAIKMLVLGHKFPSTKLMQRIMIPWTHIVYSTIPIVYFGLSGNSKDFHEYLKHGKYAYLINDPIEQNDMETQNRYEFKLIDMWRTVCY